MKFSYLFPCNLFNNTSASNFPALSDLNKKKGEARIKLRGKPGFSVITHAQY